MLSALSRDDCREREVRCQVGGRLGKERRHGKTRKGGILDSSLPWRATVQGMKSNLTLD